MTDSPTLLLTQLVHNFNRLGVTYGLLNGADDFPQKIGNDVDIWVSDGSCSAFREALAATLAQSEWDIIKPNVSPRIRKRLEGKYYLVKKQPPFHVIHLDIWTFPHWRGLPYIDVEVLEEHIVPHQGGFYAVSPAIAAGISLLKYLLHTGQVSHRHRTFITEALDRNREVLFDLLRRPLGEDTARLIVQLAQHGRWEELERSRDRIRSALIWNTLKRQPLRQLQRWLQYGFSILQLFITQYGLHVVLMGPDGVGKTTVARGLLESNVLAKLFAREFYFHTKFPLLPSLRDIARRLGLITRPQAGCAGEPARQTKPLPPVRCMIYPIYYGLGYMLGHLWLWKAKTRGGSLVIFDRYYYEYLIQSEFSRCPKGLVRLIGKVVPQPDLVLLFRNDPEVIYNRKQELPIHIIQQQLGSSEQFVHSFPGHTAIIDTDAEIEKVTERALQAILATLCDKYAR